MSHQITIPERLAGERLDIALAELTGKTRSQLQKQIKLGLVTIAGEPVSVRFAVNAGETVTIKPVAEPDIDIATPEIPVLYEDADVLVINKPADLAVHLSETGRPQPTVAAFAAAHGVVDDNVERPGIVHRLDKDTSGAMVIAKNPETKADLQRQFKERTVAKTYIALVRGRLSQPEAMIDLPIARDRSVPVKRAVVPGGRPSRTHYRVLEVLEGASLLEITLHTGRTHQIRVHMAHLGHPVIGDTLYGDSKLPTGLSRQFLHASDLEFTVRGEPVRVHALLPAELQAYLNSLRNQV